MLQRKVHLKLHMNIHMKVNIIEGSHEPSDEPFSSHEVSEKDLGQGSRGLGTFLPICTHLSHLEIWQEFVKLFLASGRAEYLELPFDH